MTTSQPTQLPCPTCQKSIIWSEAFPYRPFCCQRCQQIDFGGWASESFALPGEPITDPGLIEELYGNGEGEGGSYN